MRINQKPITYLSLLFCFFLFFILWGCGNNSSPEKNSTKKITSSGQTLKKLAVSINTTLKSSPVILAQELGLFKQNGLDVTLIATQTAAESLKALYDNKVSIATAPEHLVAFEILKKKDIQIIATVNRNQTQELVARKDRGIHSVEDLRGKKIAIKKKSSSIYWLYRLLAYSSLEMKDIVLIDAQPSRLVKMLTEGSVDAIVTWHPHAYKARQALAKNAYHIPAQLGQDMYWLTISKRTWLSKNETVAVKFLQSLNQANEHIQNNLLESKRILGKYLRADKEYIDFEWPLHIFKLELPQNLLLAMEQEIQWRIEQPKVEGNIPNFINYINFNALSQVDPNRISIIH